MKIHELKTWPIYFSAVLDGSKTFEVRHDDRGYAVGDQLHLREWDPSLGTAGEYTGRECRRYVSCVMRGGIGHEFGLPYNLVILGLRPGRSRAGEDAADRFWAKRMIALCEAAGVDPATLEDGPEALHDAIVSLRADLIAANEDCDKLKEQLREALDLQERMAEERVAALRGEG